MEPITMAISIGASIFNSWQASEKSKELQAKQKDIQLAAQKHEFERMRKLQREAAQLALEIESEIHEQRLDEIEKNYDDTFKQVANKIAIAAWPLKVLPFVMKGESFGSYIKGSKSLAIHCILTPSNCSEFNKTVYPELDLRIESSFNKYWNARSTHPIAYYGDAWLNPQLNLIDIDLLKARLSTIPTIVITPYFDANNEDKLYIRIKLWGIGINDDLGEDIRIDLPDGLFSYKDEYKKGMNYFPEEDSADDLYNTTIEEFTNYLTNVVGYLADVYYWKYYRIAPVLPQQKIADSKMLEAYKDGYLRLYNDFISSQNSMLYEPEKSVELYSGIKFLVSNDEATDLISKSYKYFCNLRSGDNSSINLSTEDVPYLQLIKDNSSDISTEKQINQYIESIKSNIPTPIWFCANTNELLQRIVKSQDLYNGEVVFVMKSISSSIAIGVFLNNPLPHNISFDEIELLSYHIVIFNEDILKQKLCAVADLNDWDFTKIDEIPDVFSVKLNSNELKKVQTEKRKYFSDMITNSNKFIAFITNEPSFSSYIISKDMNYGDIISWAKNNYSCGDQLNIVIGYSQEHSRYFVSAYYTINGVPVDGNKLFCLCNTIDDTISEKFKNAFIYIIPIKN